MKELLRLEEETHREIKIGNIFNATGGNFVGMVYDKYGLAPALLSMQGGCRQPIVVEVKKITEEND